MTVTSRMRRNSSPLELAWLREVQRQGVLTLNCYLTNTYHPSAPLTLISPKSYVLSSFISHSQRVTEPGFKVQYASQSQSS